MEESCSTIGRSSPLVTSLGLRPSSAPGPEAPSDVLPHGTDFASQRLADATDGFLTDIPVRVHHRYTEAGESCGPPPLQAVKADHRIATRGLEREIMIIVCVSSTYRAKNSIEVHLRLAEWAENCF